MLNQSENDLHINAPSEINHLSEIELNNFPPMIEKTNKDLDNRNLNDELRLFPTYDCSMPKPPTSVTDKPPIKQHKIVDYGINASTQPSNMEEETNEIPIEEDTNPQEASPKNENVKASIRIDLNHQSPNLISKQLEPESRQELIGNVEKPKTSEVEIIAEPRANASTEIPLHIVHKLPDAQMLDLMR